MCVCLLHLIGLINGPHSEINRKRPVPFIHPIQLRAYFRSTSILNSLRIRIVSTCSKYLSQRIDSAELRQLNTVTVHTLIGVCVCVCMRIDSALSLTTAATKSELRKSTGILLTSEIIRIVKFFFSLFVGQLSFG